MTKKGVVLFRKALVFLIIINTAGSAESALTDVVENIAKNDMQRWAENLIIVDAVKQANQQKEKSLSEINQLDEQWIASEDADGWINSFLENSCAQYLRQIQVQARGRSGARSLYAEIFVMDKQGCIVAATTKTSDYWQGDEDKFVRSFDNGRGVIFIGDPVYDQSTARYLIQVSVPVLDPETGKALGVLTAGVDLDVLVQQKQY